MLGQGDKIDWFPPHMANIYRDWTSNLAFDWCISRQRFFGVRFAPLAMVLVAPGLHKLFRQVPFPMWYEIDQTTGQIQRNKPIFPSKDKLPIDPLFDCPEGFTEVDRGQKVRFP